MTNVLAVVPVDGKVKRKRVKKEKDPNAPKRPLTAFFLYSTYARPLVKSDLGDKSAPVDINNEILRRWQNMSEAEKNVSSSVVSVEDRMPTDTS
jgi:transcriptional regulator HMO1